MPSFSRYEHSLGVLALLEKAGVSFEEKLAGLFHDVSHTAFSHIGDHLLGKANEEHSYQDTIHLDFLKSYEFEKNIAPLGLSLEDMNPDKPEYRGLEQHHPALCADRLQYILHTGVIMNKISKEESCLIVRDLQFDGFHWYFCDEYNAKKFAELSIYFTKNLWGSEWNFFIYEIFTRILKRAIQCQLIDYDDIQYGTDQKIMDVLNKSDDFKILKGLDIIRNAHTYFAVTTFGSGYFNVKPKCRAVDPLLKIGSEFKKLSQVNVTFKESLESIQNWCFQGYGVNPLNIEPLELAI